jgi:hypothetical protein
MPSREPRRRSVTVTTSPAEVRIATGARAYFVFGVSIEGNAVEVDPTRIKVVDTGPRSLIIEALSQPRPGERWPMRVPLADGKSPALAEFALVSHPSEVDTEIEVARSAPPETACQTACAPCPAMTATAAIVSGFIDTNGVQTAKVLGFTDTASGFELTGGFSYRAGTWALVDVEIIPRPGRPQLRPTGATLKSKTGEARVRAVKVEPSKLHPGEALRVLVETDAPPSSAGLEFTLHLHGAEGAPSFSIPTVTLPPAKERKP